MAEKAVLVDKLPPVKSNVASTPPPVEPKSVTVEPKSAPIPEPVEIETMSINDPVPPAFQLAAGVDRSSTNKKAQEKEVVIEKPVKPEPEILLADAQQPPIEGEALTKEPETQEASISGFQNVTYYTFILNLLVFGFVGIFFLSRGLNKKADVRHRPMINYGIFLLVLAFVYYYMKGAFASYLWGEIDSAPLAVRSLSWMILAPVLFLLIANLLRTGKAEQKRFLIISGLAVLLFGSIAISAVHDIGQGIRITFTILSFIASIGACFLLFLAYRDFSEDLNPHVAKGFTIIVGVIAGGWFLYPWLNAASVFFNAPSVFLFLLNFVDLGLMAGVTYGVYESTAKVSENIAVKPKAPVAMKPQGPKPKAPPAPRKAS
ncbi:hypothetical protein [Rubellicoccus peritrichatus]|uniref:Uncharacterized protein n=1 Tax=Rubellicoccus peritrichatus TaxID=3080537 RepID=A0AAQ3LDF8_9BACT|nr:hypothetical protein [Puniceicoccus sp. CR14]WOO42502.1 hypothetical protein RZN69_05325 [Puniceicoccus sp. CR14]